MDDARLMVEAKRTAVRDCADNILDLLRKDSGPSSVLYYELSLSMRELAEVWSSHVETFARIAEAQRAESPHLSIFLSQLQKASAEIAKQLETLSTPIWPRTPDLGLNALRARAGTLLSGIFRQLEKERSVWPPPAPKPEFRNRSDSAEPASAIPA